MFNQAFFTVLRIKKSKNVNPQAASIVLRKKNVSPANQASSPKTLPITSKGSLPRLNVRAVTRKTVFTAEMKKTKCQSNPSKNAFFVTQGSGY